MIPTTIPTHADAIKWYLDAAVAVITILGVPGAILSYIYSTRKERAEREYGTYNTLDIKYLEYLEICLQHPALDVFDIPLPEFNPNPEQARQQSIIFGILIAVLERAYLMYRDKSKKVQDRQWTGWKAYSASWASREVFKKEWEKQKGEFDKEFEVYMNGLVSKSQAANP